MYNEDFQEEYIDDMSGTVNLVSPDRPFVPDAQQTEDEVPQADDAPPFVDRAIKSISFEGGKQYFPYEKMMQSEFLNALINTMDRDGEGSSNIMVLSGVGEKGLIDLYVNFSNIKYIEVNLEDEGDAADEV